MGLAANDTSRLNSLLPVKHGLHEMPRQWTFSSLHRLIRENVYPSNWGVNRIGASIEADGWDV